jgi:ribosome-associated translation inhibitor RaiA
MSETEEGPPWVLDERLRLGAGFGEDDRERALTELSALAKHLAAFDPEDVDLEVSVKNRDSKEQKVTLEAWLPGWPRLVATSNHPDLDHALIEARKDLIRQIEDEKSRREPHKGRARRPTT